jgi:ComF family protein
LPDTDVLVPVPLHWTRLFARRFNQAALLAQALGRLVAKPVVVDALVRHKKTPSQGHLGLTARRRNVQGAFRVPPGRQSQIQGKRVVLVDDVYTTGSTVRVATKALLRAGAARVDVLTLARVVKGQGV